jgi:hypothetical protein
LYPWHPWFGLQVAIHEAVEKADGVVFRCTMSGSGADRWLEVPAWMFERTACPEQVRLITEPFVKITALSTLADLLRQVLKDQRASSNAPLSGASKFSHDQNRREAHDSIEVSATVSQDEGTPGNAGKQSARTGAADRPVRRRFGHCPDGHTGVAGAAGGDACHADQPDGTADPGTCRDAPRLLNEGDQP